MAGGVTTRYTAVDGDHVAYQVVGAGPPDLVFMPHWFGNVEALWDLAPLAKFTRHLASFSRVVLFDKRGTGLSDSSPQKSGPFLEAFVDDLRTVVETVGADRIALVAGDTAGLVATMFAAAYPDRVSGLILINSFPGLVPREEYPTGLPPEEAEEHRSDIYQIWLDGDLGRVAPSLSATPGAAAPIVRFLRMSASPSAAYEARSQVLDLDVRDILPSVRVPTLVIHRAEDRFFGIAHGRYLAEHIPGARFVEVPGEDHLMYIGEPDPVLREIEKFVKGERRPVSSERVLTTVLFTDIVESTSRASRAGDSSWRQTLDGYEEEVGRRLDQFRGTQVKNTGDGILATFDGPGRAIECACALRDSAALLGLSLRAGLHTGEVEMRGADVSGIAVHIAQRIQALSNPGEVLVSRTVTDLVAGSGIEFVDRGEHELRGVPGEWRLFRAEA